MSNKNNRQVPLNIVQWATGNIGLRSLAAVIDHPHLNLVGVHVYSAAKVGKDAGELCGREPIGVAATNTVEDILALRPDCVLYMPQWTNVDELTTLLAAGINVVTTHVDFHNPRLLDDETRERIERACSLGASSLYSTGSSPGFITEVIPLSLLSIQRRLDALVIDEFADLTTRDSPELLFDIMGFGQPPIEFDEARLAHVKQGFALSLSQITDAIGMPLDDISVVGEVGVVSNDVTIAAGILKAGTVGAQRITVTGMYAGRALVQMRLNWYCTTQTDKDWDFRGNGWRVQVFGDTPIDVNLAFSIPADIVAQTTPGYTAHRAVNAISVVCDAEPGIRMTTELPQVIAYLGK